MPTVIRPSGFFLVPVPPSASVVLFVQDWGGLLGLRLVASMPERFAAVIAANTGLPTGDAGASKAFLKWLKFSQTVEVLPVGMIVSGGTANGLSEEAVDAYDAPFATEEAQAGARTRTHGRVIKRESASTRGSAVSYRACA